MPKRYQYRCANGEVKLLKTEDQTALQHGRYFIVICDKCCTTPVSHLLEEVEED